MTDTSNVSDGQNVRGERAAALVHAFRSVQSRVSNALAAALMITLGLAALTWYYTSAVTRPAHTRAVAQSGVAARVQSEMPLPPLGRIAALNSASDPPAAERAIQSAELPQEAPLSEASAHTWSTAPSVGTADGTHFAPTTVKNPAALARERRLAGEVFARVSSRSTRQDAGGAAPSSTEADFDTASNAAHPGSGHVEGSSLQALLRPAAATTVQARILPNTRFLLPKGAFIDCTLETAIDSTLPGMTTCVTPADTFGADGKVVLLERGSKLVGETRGQVQQGQARIFVVWTEARTPTGVIVPLDSPGTDELGRAGLPGEVDHHFWERFGAAMLISVVNGAVQAGVQAANHSGGAVIYAPSTSQDVMTEVLRGTVNIAPTVVKRNGDRIQVLVARDLDFRPVYELRAPVTDR